MALLVPSQKPEKRFSHSKIHSATLPNRVSTGVTGSPPIHLTGRYEVANLNPRLIFDRSESLPVTHAIARQQFQKYRTHLLIQARRALPS